MPKTPLKTDDALPDFDSLGPGCQAAERWIGAMAAVGGKFLDYPKCLDFDDWSAAKFGKAMRKWRTSQSDQLTDEAFELMEGWLAVAMGDPAGQARALSKMSWCFQIDADAAQSEGYWELSDGTMIYIWPTDAPGHDIEAMTMPHDLLGVDQPMEAVWALGEGEASGHLSMKKAWNAMEGWGCHFDMARQKSGDFFHGGRGFDEDSENPLHMRVVELIPALSAAGEKISLSKATADTKASKPKPRI